VNSHDANQARSTFALRTWAATLFLTFVSLSAPAFADTPDTWETTASSPARTILLFVVLPVLIAGFVTLVAAVPGWRGKEHERKQGGLVVADEGQTEAL
jgi:hypothetical protein